MTPTCPNSSDLNSRDVRDNRWNLYTGACYSSDTAFGLRGYIETF